MLAELELKAVIPDPEALRGRLRSAGAIAGFRGRMTDRRYDRAGELAARDEVLRIRTYHHPNGGTESVLAWKGATSRSPEGYKLRQEIELAVQSERGAAERLLGRAGLRAGPPDRARGGDLPGGGGHRPAGAVSRKWTRWWRWRATLKRSSAPSW